MNPELGLLSYKNDNSRESFYKPYSEETGRLIDREARTIVDEQYARVKEMLLEKRDLMMAMSERLEEKETLVYADLRDVLGERPFAIKDSYKQFVSAGGNPFSVDPSEEHKDSTEATKEGSNSSSSGGGEAPVVPESVTTAQPQPSAA